MAGANASAPGIHRRPSKMRRLGSPESSQLTALSGLEPIDGSSMWVDPAWKPQIARAGLTSFAKVMSTSGGRRLRSLRDRENWRLVLTDDGGQSHGAYLKRHRVRTLGSWLRAKLSLGTGETAGSAEAHNLARLDDAGIATMRLIAYGERLHRDGWLESFVITEELAGYEQLDHFLRRRFAPLDGSHAAPRDPHRRALLEQVARLARQFHRLGYNHRDLYCCHFFVHETARGRFDVNLIDLQRVEHRRRLRRRWIVKDLAQLAYSAPAEQLTCGGRMAFIKEYLGVDKLRPTDKRLIREVLAKLRVMQRRLGLHP